MSKPRQDYRGDFLGTILCAVHRRPAAEPIASRCNADAIDPRDEQIREFVDLTFDMVLDSGGPLYGKMPSTWLDKLEALKDALNGPPSSTKTDGGGL